MNFRTGISGHAVAPVLGRLAQVKDSIFRGNLSGSKCLGSDSGQLRAKATEVNPGNLRSTEHGTL